MKQSKVAKKYKYIYIYILKMNTNKLFDQTYFINKDHLQKVTPSPKLE